MDKITNTNKDRGRGPAPKTDHWTNGLSGKSDEYVNMNNATSEGSRRVTTLTIERDPLNKAYEPRLR